MPQSFFGPIRTLILAAALWLPLTFFIWFAFRNALLQPLAWIVNTVLGFWSPELVYSLEVRPGGEAGALSQHHLFWGLQLPIDQSAIDAGRAMGSKAIYELDFNPLIYCYGMPLFAGLVMATPLTIKSRFKQILFALPVLYLFQAWGVLFDLFQNMAFRMDPFVTSAKLAVMGLDKTFIAAGYQLGYLLMPSVVPLLLWCGFNQRFLQRLTESDDDITLESLAEDTVPAPSNEAQPAASESNEVSHGNR
jgi:hypothetical protein